ESGAVITDSSVLSFIGEGFTAGTQLTFTLGLTLNDDAGGIPDRLTFFIVDSSGVPLPTLAPAGDYFLGVSLGSSGPVFAAYASDPSRSPSAGDPVSIPAPTIVPGAPTVGAPVASPSSIPANALTLVTVTSQIGDPTVIAGGVNLLQVNSTGGSPTILGVMHDDGKNGDAVAGDGIFTLQVTLNPATVGAVYLEASAAFKGLLERALSPITPVSVTSGLKSATGLDPKQ
ncbi:MAG: choice-of-anchor X domain-containing protein, partial [Bryobacteraceae bacterium]